MWVSVPGRELRVPRAHMFPDLCKEELWPRWCPGVVHHRHRVDTQDVFAGLIRGTMAAWGTSQWGCDWHGEGRTAGGFLCGRRELCSEKLQGTRWGQVSDLLMWDSDSARGGVRKWECVTQALSEYPLCAQGWAQQAPPGRGPFSFVSWCLPCAWNSIWLVGVLH